MAVVRWVSGRVGVVRVVETTPGKMHEKAVFWL